MAGTTPRSYSHCGTLIPRASKLTQFVFCSGDCSVAFTPSRREDQPPVKKQVICYHCRGRKRFIDPEAQPDPVEMYKDARRFDCPTCFGRGTMAVEAVRAHLKWCLEQYGSPLS